MSVPATFSFSGETGEMPAVGFGTSPMTGAMSAETVLAALKAGYRHIDTARKYGTESAVGQAMRASGLPRQCGRYCTHRRAQARQWPHRQPGWSRAGRMGLIGGPKNFRGPR